MPNSDSLFNAIYDGDIHSVRQLLDEGLGQDKDVRNRGGDTLLQRAVFFASKNKLAIIQILLKNGHRFEADIYQHAFEGVSQGLAAIGGQQSAMGRHAPRTARVAKASHSLADSVPRAGPSHGLRG